jgi:hypothetical protein
VLFHLLHPGLHLLELLLGHPVDPEVSEGLLGLVLDPKVEREVGVHILVVLKPHDLALEDRQLLVEDAGHQVGVGVPELRRQRLEHDGHLGVLVSHPEPPALGELAQDFVRECL